MQWGIAWVAVPLCWQQNTIHRSAALAVLAPADTRPSAVKAAASVRIPALIISGENDCITRPEAHQIPIFNALQSISKITDND